MFLIKVLFGVVVGLALIIFVLWVISRLSTKDDSDITEENILSWFRKRR
jgi:NhaP-type Na+/H+ or K+/H+ antiporter